MKITVCFLLVAFSCCFNPAASNCVKRCSSACQQNQLNDINCLKNALRRNRSATVIAMTNFLCVYDRFKVSGNKGMIARALQDLQRNVGCNLANLIGADITLETLSDDVNGALQDLLRSCHDILSPLNFGDYIIPRCGQVRPLLRKISKILFLYGTSSFNEQSQETTKINGVSRFLAIVLAEYPKLFQAIIESLLGSGPLVKELAFSLSGLNRIINKNVGDMAKTLYGTKEMATETGHLLQSNGGTVKESNGLSGVTGLLPPVINVADSVVRGIGKTLNTVLGEPNGGLLYTARGLIPNIVEGVSGGSESKDDLLGSITSTVLNTLEGPLGGSRSKDGILGSVKGLVPKLLGGSGSNGGLLGSDTSTTPYILGGVLDSSGSSDGLIASVTELVPNLLGGSGSDDLASLQASGRFMGSLGQNVGISAGGKLGIGLGKHISNTGMFGESIIENGGANFAGSSIPESGVSRTKEATANGLYGRLFQK